MEIYLLRHGAAEPRTEGIADENRALTRAGRRGVQAVLQRARAAIVKPALIFTSSLIRARETAEITQQVLRSGELVETPALLPDVSPSVLWTEIGAHHGIKALVIVGHQPQLSRLAALLLEAAVLIDFKKGAMARISVRGNHPPRGVLHWIITPQLVGGK